MPTGKTAFVGGKVWTAGFSGPRRLDVLVEHERIRAVARTGELDISGARVIDLRGRLLMPGFQDAHAHPLLAGLNLIGCDLFDARTADQALAMIAAHAAAAEGEWIVGGGWHRDLFPAQGPSRRQLDTVTGDRPAYLRSFDCHGAWVNSAALRAAGVDGDTPDPENGVFVRDADGTPTGMLEEQAQLAIRRVMPPETTQTHVRAMRRAGDYLTTLGITSVQDAIVGGGFGIANQIPAYRELLRTRTWRGRLTAALWWDDKRGPEQVPELLAKREELESAGDADWVIADTVKLMVDGSNTVFIDRDATRAATVALSAAGFSCHYHSYGELATNWILDAIAAAREAGGPGGARHHIAHLMVITDGDFARFAPLDVTANVQAAWGHLPVRHDMLGLATCSDDGHLREYAFGRLAAAGARLAAGSDWPVSTPDPLEAARLAVSRGRDRKRERTGAVGDPDELDRLDLPGLFTAYTAGSAHVNGRALTTGRIAPGFLADLVLLDRDPFDGEHAIDDTVVDQTWIHGTNEYTRSTA